MSSRVCPRVCLPRAPLSPVLAMSGRYLTCRPTCPPTKSAFIPSDASPAQPPKQGRPRKFQPIPVPQTAAKRALGHTPSSAKPGGTGRPSSSAKTGRTARPSSPAPAECRTRSRRTFAILPLVADWRGGSVDNDISPYTTSYLGLLSPDWPNSICLID